ncbi:glycoside hydrolase family 3 N-terminal domain-containing protein [Pseudomonas gingeri]|uniref:Glycoside hydrolase n=1 Tax=Pseudomonas gingeri TaxID=117681 RepID=A0A7Y8CJW7_9PSED|nr:glycoside hydrolase family 3 N-terminal domain-containing protein [Pseudomonas gingeri]NWB26505.1 glycoside hydrolase [Pseudomonas gingeri]NWC32945.1 glycoside hydrolase [Pseudomonas gingeri]NWD06877.1 glycoside hydrolase [Pseudomonas gingeri]NWD48299.1 glycoside hydrolase [Pseudomonas gingeri]NWE26507.1 glycoside hydrolase [Pseudomonas gingeri]
MSTYERKAYSVLFPVVLDLQMTDDVRRFLGNGGRSLLFGETAEEYVSGKMSASRLEAETLDAWQRFSGTATELGGPLLLAADADISAVHRLQGITPALPEPDAARAMDSSELEETCFQVATAVRNAGVNLLLSPTADVLGGPNIWLKGRTLSDDIPQAAAMVAAYVRGVRRAGLASTLKHFPGHPVLLRQPAVEEAVVGESMAQLRRYWPTFQAGIDAGADAVMMGPARFAACTPPVSASISAELIGLLRQELGFKGLVMTIDLDHRSVIGHSSLGEVAVAALRAGADLLLISARAMPQIAQVVQAIVAAIADGSLPQERLDAAALAVSTLAER